MKYILLIVILFCFGAYSSPSVKTEPLWLCSANFKDARGKIQIFTYVVAAIRKEDAVNIFKGHVLKVSKRIGYKKDYVNWKGGEDDWFVNQITDDTIIR